MTAGEGVLEATDARQPAVVPRGDDRRKGDGRLRLSAG